METEKAGGYISQITFNNGQTTVDINSDDIVVFVGPNNAGKSQALKDIYKLSGNGVDGVVISNIKIIKYKQSLDTFLSEKTKKLRSDNTWRYYNFLGNEYSVDDGTDDEFQNRFLNYDRFRDLFVVNLDTESRLQICKPPQAVNRKEPWTHPIHYIAFDKQYYKWVTEKFRKAFGTEIIPFLTNGNSIPLCLGEQPIILNEDINKKTSTKILEFGEILDQYPQVHEQGDGIKSFTGILLYMVLDHYCTYLIDEPESFLHPPQAKKMGEVIGQTLAHRQQAFISTHSEELIKGLLEVCPERIKIIRITRQGDTNYFSILDSNLFSKIWADPLLKYSNIMSSLFHKTVVLCEADSDCKMYSLIEGHIKQTNGSYSETLFIHCGGKHRMAKVANALRSLNVDLKLIPDIDVLDNESTFKGIVSAFGIDWSSIEKDYKEIVSNLHSPREQIERERVKNDIMGLLNKSDEAFLSKEEIKELRKLTEPISKWKKMKSYGVPAIPPRNASAAFNHLNQSLKDAGIFIVPVGELECFIKDVGGHGPEWVNSVLENHSDLNDPVYDEIKKFINGMNL